MSDAIEYDVLVVGGGPAGLATAIRLKQLAAAAGRDVSVCVLEKGAAVGDHILSGAVIETRGLDELLPGWQSRTDAAGTEVGPDEFHLLTGPGRSIRVSRWLVPAPMHNAGHRIVSLGRLCQWLADEAAALDVDLFAGFAGVSPLFDADGRVTGIRTGDVGRDRNGRPKPAFEPGIEIGAKYTVIAEGARGHLARQLIDRFELAAGRDPQHYGIGLKELWQIDPARHTPGRVVHGAGWPLGRAASGGFFAYHAADSLVALGLIVDLNYRNPWLDPFRELQRLKHHPLLAAMLDGGERIAYGARAIAKGGAASLPRLAMPGAVLVGCAAGTLNYAKIKGTHTAVKSGIVAAESLFAALARGESGTALDDYDRAFGASWAGRELARARNFGSALHRFGLYGGAAWNWLEQTLLGGRSPVGLHDRIPDHAALEPAAARAPIDYPAPDGRLSFDRMSSVYLSGTHHEEDQPCHLLLADPDRAIDVNLARFAGPEQRYCPAGVYEFIGDGDDRRLQINAANCLHCKVCDIKDPGQNITWVPPESGGPVYNGM